MQCPSGKKPGSGFVVAIRVRPPEVEESSFAVEPSHDHPDKKIILRNFLGDAHDFEVDHVFWSTKLRQDGINFASQEKVHNDIGIPVVDKVEHGFNSSVLGFGETGSGKTFTVTGDLYFQYMYGLVPRICRDLMVRLEGKAEFRLSYVEIYAEKITDLLVVSATDQLTVDDHLQLKEHNVDGPFVEGATVVLIGSFDEFYNILHDANLRRQRMATVSDERQARGHAVLTLTVGLLESDPEVLTFEDELKDENGTRMKTEDKKFNSTSKLTFVDMAGSEGLRSKERGETHAMHTSLKYFDIVIKALSSTESKVSKMVSKFEAGESQSEILGEKKFNDTIFDCTSAGVATARGKDIPFKNSVLTSLLRDSLGGNSFTTVIATIKPDLRAMDDTLSTLEFASCCRRIVNRPVFNENPFVRTIKLLRRQVSQLQRQLERASSASPTMSMLCEGILSPDSSSYLSATLDTSNDHSRGDQCCEIQFEDSRNGVVVLTANDATVGKPVNIHGLNGDGEWEEPVNSAGVFEATPKIDLKANRAQSHHAHKVVDGKDGEVANVWSAVDSDDGTHEDKERPCHDVVEVRNQRWNSNASKETDTSRGGGYWDSDLDSDGFEDAVRGADEFMDNMEMDFETECDRGGPDLDYHGEDDDGDKSLGGSVHKRRWNSRASLASSSKSHRSTNSVGYWDSDLDSNGFDDPMLGVPLMRSGGIYFDDSNDDELDTNECSKPACDGPSSLITGNNEDDELSALTDCTPKGRAKGAKGISFASSQVGGYWDSDLDSDGFDNPFRLSRGSGIEFESPDFEVTSWDGLDHQQSHLITFKTSFASSASKGSIPSRCSSKGGGYWDSDLDSDGFDGLLASSDANRELDFETQVGPAAPIGNYLSLSNLQSSNVLSTGDKKVKELEEAIKAMFENDVDCSGGDSSALTRPVPQLNLTTPCDDLFLDATDDEDERRLKPTRCMVLRSQLDHNITNVFGGFVANDCVADAKICNVQSSHSFRQDGEATEYIRTCTSEDDDALTSPHELTDEVRRNAFAAHRLQALEGHCKTTPYLASHLPGRPKPSMVTDHPNDIETCPTVDLGGAFLWAGDSDASIAPPMRPSKRNVVIDDRHLDKGFSHSGNDNKESLRHLLMEHSSPSPPTIRSISLRQPQSHLQVYPANARFIAGSHFILSVLPSRPGPLTSIRKQTGPSVHLSGVDNRADSSSCTQAFLHSNDMPIRLTGHKVGEMFGGYISSRRGVPSIYHDGSAASNTQHLPRYRGLYAVISPEQQEKIVEEDPLNAYVRSRRLDTLAAGPPVPAPTKCTTSSYAFLPKPTHVQGKDRIRCDNSNFKDSITTSFLNLVGRASESRTRENNLSLEPTDEVKVVPGNCDEVKCQQTVIGNATVEAHWRLALAAYQETQRLKKLEEKKARQVRSGKKFVTISSPEVTIPQCLRQNEIGQQTELEAEAGFASAGGPLGDSDGMEGQASVSADTVSGRPAERGVDREELNSRDERDKKLLSDWTRELNDVVVRQHINQTRPGCIIC